MGILVNKVRELFVRSGILTTNTDAGQVVEPVPYLLCSAIWYKDLPTMRLLPKNCDKGIVLCGWRHGNIIAQMEAMMGLRTVVNGENSVGEYEQGFLTNDNRFVARVEAADIAFKSGQIKIKKNYLFSEDLW
jgi:hypothetical protein